MIFKIGMRYFESITCYFGRSYVQKQTAILDQDIILVKTKSLYKTVNYTNIHYFFHF